jgi:hypothetical protein
MPRQPARIIQPPANGQIKITVRDDEQGTPTFSYNDNDGHNESEFLLRRKPTVIFYASPDNPAGRCEDFKISFSTPTGTDIQLDKGDFGNKSGGEFTSTGGFNPTSKSGIAQSTQAIAVVVLKSVPVNELVRAPFSVTWTFADGKYAGKSFTDDPDGYFEC